ncbi:DegS sensor signal transduction histidine kinase [Tepidanaerobacter acetatoxydans Re1]|uniref:histidine kinase n=1 Tax=Tepidanaerobacter acetatoxydans (strain DSM 21804 / JCM 16047 / Re1) TaxID=1209989 RepID=F4LWW6_TEPAE|nr:sensor histidine kinase [Tepidanaerobacter acetatoxydans]AEE91838.1 DegS sensor signal transduction histidine kinase [Tepidanaerobacter acetatoxydans Re1]CDI40826.1 DegS sensor signal transduction histidine kinase [Tepidanaerobacter acetatoxydans Re1]
MHKTQINIEYLNEVINSTIDAIEKGQKEIFNIFEHARQECERIQRELEDLKAQVKDRIREVDNLAKLEKSAKFKLMIVSRDFEKHSEEDIKAAYEETKDIQIRLSIERQKEIQLREKRDDLERNLKSMLNILNQSEHLMMQLGVALGFLKGDLKDMSGHISDINERRNLAAKIIKAQEEERQRVARDIHDGPAQTLANIVIQTDICERLMERDLNEAKKELNQLKKIVRSSLQELRKIIFNLRPSSLDNLGLQAVTKRYCEEFQEETGIRTEFRFFGDKTRLGSEIEVTIFRLIQEALTNVKKHSKAKNCIVKLEFGDGKANLVIADDGVGFEVSTKDSSDSEQHFGIMTIKERVALVDGSFNIESEPGQGTKLFATIPFANRL